MSRAETRSRNGILGYCMSCCLNNELSVVTVDRNTLLVCVCYMGLAEGNPIRPYTMIQAHI